MIYFILLSFLFSLLAQKGESVYTRKFNDPEALFFTPENFSIKNDGKTDVSEILQQAINTLKTEKNFGIIFIPEGSYLISRTIYIPNAIRLIGYGKTRPVFILGQNTPGYQDPVPDDKSNSNYIFWFTGAIVAPGRPVSDANPGTFYSGFSNIDIRIENGNPNAVALRTHYAQHGFVSHCDIYTGSGKAGIFDVGNEIQDVRFFGGDYGILTTTPSPSWPFFMVDTYFEGQRKAAIRTRNAGLTIVGMHVRKVPVAVEIEPGQTERLFMESCLLEDVKVGIKLGMEDNSLNQINLLNIDCRDVPALISFISGKKINISGETYRVNSFTYGLCMEDMTANSGYNTLSDIVSFKNVPDELSPDIPVLPDMSEWVNIKELGAVGDGKADDTQAFKDAIAKYPNIYVPLGWYRITETLKLNPNTCLIGLHPFATQLMLAESTPAFSGFGPPKAMVETSEGGNAIFSGIGINTGGYNYRAVGCKWMAGTGSLMNDVKFVGGHGTMAKGPVKPSSSSRTTVISSPSSPVTAAGRDLAWDNQYWSLWITKNGGGTFKDIWSANTYSASGLYVSNTSTQGRIYAMSLEHHVRNEARFSNVSNWKIYAFQQEEESREGIDCQPVEMVNCRNIMFANLWLFRVIRVNTPRPTGVRLWDCENIVFLNLHNYAQVMHVTEIPVYDFTRQIPVYPWEFAKMTVTGKEQGRFVSQQQEPWTVQKIATGFEFAQGITSDSKGNIYFCETRLRRIYKWSAITNTVSLLSDYPWKPITLACDEQDNLLVVFRYDPQPGLIVNGQQETVVPLPDDNPGYSGWGNGGWAAWAYSVDPDNPDETLELLPRVATSEIKDAKFFLYPSSRWRYDFDTSVLYMPQTSFVAPDHVTAIPETYDLGRSAALSAAIPGEPFYVSDESLKRIVRLDVEKSGKLFAMRDFVQRGEFSSATDSEGNVYVADGLIYIFDKEGNEKGMIKLDERPISIHFGGTDKNTLFITTNSSLYSVRTN